MNNEKINTIAKTTAIIDEVRKTQEMKEEMRANRASIIADEEITKKIDAAVMQMTEDKVASLTLEECNEILCVTEETSDLGMKFESVDRELEFKRSYLEYCRNTAIAYEQIDDMNKKLAEELEADEENIKEVFDNIGDSMLFFKEELNKRLEDTDINDIQRKRIEESIMSLDDSMEFDELYNMYSSLSAKNVMRDYLINSQSIYDRYKRKISKLELKTEITRFAGLEETFLPEKYHKYNNLFLFLVIRHYSYKSDVQRHKDGVFLSQLMINVRSLFEGQLGEDKKDKMIGNIQKVLDLFY